MFSHILRLFRRKLHFNEIRSLEDNGERIEIDITKKIRYNRFDIYQKSHFKRYEFASKMLKGNEVCGDFACGTGYGSMMLSKRAKKVIGIDINSNVIEKITLRYNENEKVEFFANDLLSLDYTNYFDAIVSFETIEHLTENNIQSLFNLFSKALKRGGKIIFSTPYLQKPTKEALAMGHHLTYNIDEPKIELWLKTSGFDVLSFKYQNYLTHLIKDKLKPIDFIICTAEKHE